MGNCKSLGVGLMADMPIGAPKMPLFDPSTIIQGIGTKVQENTLQIIIFVGIGSLVIGYLIYMIWEEYKKHPLKFKRQKMGKNGFKLSDILRKK
jgi:hypothetical protein